ncbi:hypothetical protein M4I32_09940 [Microbacterium sp. LRZ72]|uniref:hypothetical protein n=1 Tax=Microbacterium sp. LRZ72 TaxID=2942481 RepID=UPI0029A559D9|nr:hypothetical protein [Microbacterium sp. LRZ72]MDX2377119.1 hypothetical protein [Microbacterium sp. LRZ72]
MATALRESTTHGDEVRRLRAQLDRIRGHKVETPALPVHSALAQLLPGQGLQPGSVYAVDSSAALLLALLAGPSRAGSWCGVIGMRGFGAEAAEEYGLDLDRLVLVPDPGPRWFAVASALAEVLPIVAVRPAGRPGDGDVSRLAARLRDRGTVLVTLGAWPGADALLSVSDPRWRGLGTGHGYLAGREVTVTASSRRFPVPRSTRMLLPDAAGTAAAVDPAPARATGDARVPTPIRAVG